MAQQKKPPTTVVSFRVKSTVVDELRKVVKKLLTKTGHRFYEKTKSRRAQTR